MSYAPSMRFAIFAQFYFRFIFNLDNCYFWCFINQSTFAYEFNVLVYENKTKKINTQTLILCVVSALVFYECCSVRLCSLTAHSFFWLVSKFTLTKTQPNEQKKSNMKTDCWRKACAHPRICAPIFISNFEYYYWTSVAFVLALGITWLKNDSNDTCCNRKANRLITCQIMTAWVDENSLVQIKASTFILFPSQNLSN